MCKACKQVKQKYTYEELVEIYSDPDNRPKSITLDELLDDMQGIKRIEEAKE